MRPSVPIKLCRDRYILETVNFTEITAVESVSIGIYGLHLYTLFPDRIYQVLLQKHPRPSASRIAACRGQGKDGAASGYDSPQLESSSFEPPPKRLRSEAGLLEALSTLSAARSDLLEALARLEIVFVRSASAGNGPVRIQSGEQLPLYVTVPAIILPKLKSARRRS